ncbi:serine hydrolase [Leptolyngbya sp. 7M]|uniref:serine hydrolase n=1 Tax=Leptolyngbya sp. 7M TaxID=2812896 RepID=UPI001B8C54A4|nr:serine hydrolase [Leptolyngbya sp. 7M]QYO65225.1 class A beta-lactamase-related serine hydrolase [Leptolyngbya sp. 7M]
MNSRRISFLLWVCLLLVASIIVRPQNLQETEIVKPKGYQPPVMVRSSELDIIVAAAVDKTISVYSAKGLKREEIAVTLIDLRDTTEWKWAESRGDSAVYPASVPKMFYMVALYQQIADGKIVPTPELERGLRDMVVDSSNEATQYIVDVLTNTSSGGELPQKEFETWSYRRNRMNRYFSSLGYNGININQKTHCEDAYGVEQQFRNYRGENRNMLTTNAAARLVAEIGIGRIGDPETNRKMMDLLRRDPFATGKNANSQATDFIGKALIDLQARGVKLYSKAGWTSRARHDAAYIEMPDGNRFAIAVFTENHANEKQLIPDIAGLIIQKLGEKNK